MIGRMRDLKNIIVDKKKKKEACFELFWWSFNHLPLYHINSLVVGFSVNGFSDNVDNKTIKRL